jgi:hypothetical protein
VPGWGWARFAGLGTSPVAIGTAAEVRPDDTITHFTRHVGDKKSGVGYQKPIPSPLNPVDLSGGQYHLRPMAACLQPGHTDRDTRVEAALA